MNLISKCGSCLTLCFLLMALPVRSQQVPKSLLQLEGEVIVPLSFSMEELKKMESHILIAKDMAGTERIYKGVKLTELLHRSGVTLGRELRGENLTKSLLMTAADGYQVIYSLAEVDPEFTDQVVLVAYEQNGNPLPIGEGPLRIIALADKRPARWIRELVSIKVLFPKD